MTETKKLKGKQVVILIDKAIRSKNSQKLKTILKENSNYSVTYVEAKMLDIQIALLNIKMINLEMATLLIN